MGIIKRSREPTTTWAHIPCKGSWKRFSVWLFVCLCTLVHTVLRGLVGKQRVTRVFGFGKIEKGEASWGKQFRGKSFWDEEEHGHRFGGPVDAIGQQ